MLVNENLINSILDDAEKGIIKQDDFLEFLSSDQQAFLNYLSQEIFPILTDEEADYLLFLLFILYHSIERSEIAIEHIDVDVYQQLEEENWEKFSETKAKKFRAKLDIFFEESEEEDLLAFIEDMLTLEENDTISPIGREPIFIVCKTFADLCITN